MPRLARRRGAFLARDRYRPHRVRVFERQSRTTALTAIVVDQRAVRDLRLDAAVGDQERLQRMHQPLVRDRVGLPGAGVQPIAEGQKTLERGIAQFFM